MSFISVGPFYVQDAAWSAQCFKDLKGLKVERLCANYRLSGDDVFGVFPLTAESAESANLIFWP